MKKIITLSFSLFFIISNQQAQTVTDFDGNVYNIVTIGTQVWMKENLKVTHYRNGSSIHNETDSAQWKNLLTGAYCTYNNDINFKQIYGLLYNWYAVDDTNNLAPAGWHISSKIEWDVLINFLGGDSVAGGKMKEIGTSHWNNPNVGATNSSGFTGLGAGYRWGYNNNPSFDAMGYYAYFWSSTPNSNTGGAYGKGLIINTPYSFTALSGADFKTRGSSIRCIKNTNTNSIDENNLNNSFNIFPNPATNMVTINLLKKSQSIMTIYNILGAVVLQEELIKESTNIDISFLEKGVYFIQLSGIESQKQSKLIKQ